MAKNTRILEQWYKDIWEDGHLDRIEDYFVNDPHNQYIVPNFGIEPTDIREWVSIIRHFLTNIKVVMIHAIEEGDWISAMLEISGVQVKNSQPIKVHQQIMLRFVDGKKAESYPAFDFIRFFEQLGQLPPDTHALLLSGTRLE